MLSCCMLKLLLWLSCSILAILWLYASSCHVAYLFVLSERKWHNIVSSYITNKKTTLYLNYTSLHISGWQIVHWGFFRYVSSWRIFNFGKWCYSQRHGGNFLIILDRATGIFLFCLHFSGLVIGIMISSSTYFALHCSCGLCELPGFTSISIGYKNNLWY